MTKIKVKAKAGNADFQAVWDNPAAFVSQAEVDALADQTIDEIIQVTRGKNVSIGWSGGKDSILLEFLCRMAGIQNGVLGIVRNLEYWRFLDWLKTGKPDYIEVESNDSLDLEWLARPENERYLFPPTGQGSYFYALHGTRRAQKIHYQKYNLDMIVFGRRYADGNFISRNEYGIHSSSGSDGMTQYCPIRNWSHEQLIAFIRYHNLSMPPSYFPPYREGWKHGTGPWSGHHHKTHFDGWLEVYLAEPETVHEAARRIASARYFLEELDLEELDRKGLAR